MQSSPSTGHLAPRTLLDRLNDKATGLRRGIHDELVKLGNRVDPDGVERRGTKQEVELAARRENDAIKAQQRGTANGRDMTIQSSATPPRYPAPPPPSPSHAPAAKPSDYTVQPLSPSFAQSRYPGPSGAPPTPSAAPSPYRGAQSHPYSHSSSSSSSSSPGISVAKPASSSSSSISSSTSVSSSTCRSAYKEALKRPEIVAVVKAVERKYNQAMTRSDYILGCQILGDAISNASDQKNEILWAHFAVLLAVHLSRFACEKMNSEAASDMREWYENAARVIRPLDARYADVLLHNASQCDSIRDDILHGRRPQLVFEMKN